MELHCLMSDRTVWDCEIGPGKDGDAERLRSGEQLPEVVEGLLHEHTARALDAEEVEEELDVGHRSGGP